MTTTATPSAAVMTRSRRFEPLRRVRPVYLLGAETLLAAIVMSWTLGRQSLWWDELHTASVMPRDAESAVRFALSNEPMTSLYLLTLRVWSAVFGKSEVALRSFSVILGVALVLAVYVLTTRLFGTRTALVAGLLTAISATVVAEAQQARQYSLLLLLVVLATLCFVRAVELRTSKSWLLYALIAALAVYAQLFAVFVIAGHVLSLLALPRAYVRWQPMAVAARAFALAGLPLLALVLQRGGAGLGWIRPTSWASVRNAFEMFAGGTGYLLLGGLVAGAFTLRSASRAWARGPGLESWRYALLATWLVAPVVGVFLASLVTPLFVDRYLLGALPAFVVVVAVGITAMRPSQLSVGFLIAFVVLNGAVLSTWLGSDTATAKTGVPREDWRGAVEFVLAHRAPGDAVLLQAGLELAWDYYGQRLGSPGRPPTVLLAGHFSLDDARHDRLWVLSSYGHAQVREVPAQVRARYALATTRRFTGQVDVLRYDARD